MNIGYEFATFTIIESDQALDWNRMIGGEPVVGLKRQEAGCSVKCRCGSRYQLTVSGVDQIKSYIIRSYVSDKTKISELVPYICGCDHEIDFYKRKRHGMANSQEYRIWTSLKSMCHKPSDPRYAEFGKKGYRLCAAWKKFEGFIRDLGTIPNDIPGRRLIIRRGEKLYNKRNCWWGTIEEWRKENNRKFVTVKDESGNDVTYTLSEYAKVSSSETGIPVHVVRMRLDRGLCGDDLKQPYKPRKKKADEHGTADEHDKGRVASSEELETGGITENGSNDDEW